MKKKHIKRLIFFIIPLLIMFFGYNYIYQDHRNIENEAPEFNLKSDILIDEFIKDSQTSEKKYLNKTIKISGKITEINNKTLIIDTNIFCQFKNQISTSIKINEPVSIKGRCIGFDDLLEEIKLDQCTLDRN